MKQEETKGLDRTQELKENELASEIMGGIARCAGGLMKHETISGRYDLQDFLDAFGDWCFEHLGERPALALDMAIDSVRTEGP